MLLYIQVKPPTSSLTCKKGSENRFAETFKTFQFGKDRTFKGVSEYDDKFVAKMPRSNAPAANTTSNAAAMNAKYSSPNPIVPAPVPEIHPYPHAKRPATADSAAGRSTNSGGGSKMSFATENRDNFQWPDGLHYKPHDKPLLNSQDSKVVVGVNHPAVRNELKMKSKKVYAPFRSAKQMESSRKFAAKTDDEFPESEFQSQFNSSNKENESAAANDKNKYHLMNESTLNRHVAAGQYHPHMQFGEKLHSTTGTALSTDSLCGATDGHSTTNSNVHK
jgi:hypothetical protein